MDSEGKLSALAVGARVDVPDAGEGVPDVDESDDGLGTGNPP